MTVYIIDTETTGTSKSDQVIELAYYNCATLEEEIDCLKTYVKDDKFPGLTEVLHTLTYTEQFLPSCPINPHAHAVHGISRTQLVGKPLSSSVSIPKDTVYLIGHNIAVFDKRLLGQSSLKLLPQLEKVKYICTLNLAKLISKHYGVHYENHKLDTLAKHYYPDYAHILVTPLHSAKNDVVKNLLVLLKLVQHLSVDIDSWDKLYNLQENIKKVR